MKFDEVFRPETIEVNDFVEIDGVNTFGIGFDMKLIRDDADDGTGDRIESKLVKDFGLLLLIEFEQFRNAFR